MPKQLWIPGGRGGGGKRDTYYAESEYEALKAAFAEYRRKFVFTKDDISRAKADAIFKERERAPKLSDLLSDGYGISRPSQNPPVLPPLDPVDAPNWTMPLRIGLGLAAVVVVVILAVVIRGVAW